MGGSAVARVVTVGVGVVVTVFSSSESVGTSSISDIDWQSPVDLLQKRSVTSWTNAGRKAKLLIKKCTC
jgi:hypothetical protein